MDLHAGYDNIVNNYIYIYIHDVAMLMDIFEQWYPFNRNPREDIWGLF